MSLYERALRLRHLHLAGWQREVLTWGMVVLGVLLALTGLVSPWGILLLPVAAAVLVKLQDAVTDPLVAAGRAVAGRAGGDDGERDEAPVRGTEASGRSEGGSDPAERQSDAT